MPDAIFCRICGKRRIEAPASEELQSCVCGNIFMPDAIFCRKCGVRRPEPEGSELDEMAGPIWNWSTEIGTRSTFLDKILMRPAGNNFRFIDRDGPFMQSLGKWNIQRSASNSQHLRDIQKLYLRDVYHSFIDGGNIWQHLFVYSVVYALCFLVFAFAYLYISDRCGLGLEGRFIRAYYLSLETMVTIGYGTPDPYYNDCWEGTFVLTFQSLLQYFLNALVIGSVFVRMTRPQARSNTILFSDKAVIQVIDNAFYLMFQVCEAKHHDLLEAHIRCYCIRHDRKGAQTYQVLPLRLQHPDDTMGGMLLLTLPCRVVHRIDNWSPLSPNCDNVRRRRLSESGSESSPSTSAHDGFHHHAKNRPVDIQRGFWTYSWPQCPQRQVDAEQGNRDTCVCSICGGSFQTPEMLRLHVQYQAAQDLQDGVPPKCCHQSWKNKDLSELGWWTVDKPPDNRPGLSSEPVRSEIDAFLRERFVEIVVMVEGIEPTSSSTLQARHSYLFPDDVVWDMDFADCLQLGNQGRPCGVDLGLFHRLCPLEEPGATWSVVEESADGPVSASSDLKQEKNEEEAPQTLVEQEDGGEGYDEDAKLCL